MAAKHTRKYAVIAFTDIVGFSKMAGKDEALALELLDEHQEVVRPLIDRFAGREVKTIGDAFMVEFGDPKPAVEWAVTVQEALHARNQASPPDRIVQIRIGLHAGDVVMRGDDLFGDGVNIAARVEPQAPHGGIAISGPVHDAVAGQIEMAFEPMEARTLKNIDKKIQLYKVVLPWLDTRKSATAAIEAAMAIFGSAAPEPEAPPPPPEPEGPSMMRLALLPLANASGNPEDAFIPAALHADLLGAFSGLPDLKVVARDSIGRIHADVTEAAKVLQAGLVLTGSAGISAGRLTLNLDCQDAVQGEKLWSQSFSSGLGEMAEVYVAVVARVAETVGVDFPDAIRKRLRRRPPASPLGFLSYLRAWYQLSLGTLDSLQRAQDAFKASLNQDGAHALSLAGMAESYAEIGLSGRTPPAQQNIYLLPGASEAALKALQLDPFLPEAHAVRGKTLTAYTFDFAGAEAHLHRALRGDEGPAATHLWLALTLVATGRIDEADEHLRKALEGDPRSPALHTVSGLVRYIAGDHAAAVKEATTALELEPTYWAASLVCGLAQAALAQYGPAEASLNAAVDRSDRHPLAVAALGCELALSGQRSSVVGLLKELDDAKRSRYVPALALAVLHLAMNQVDTALTDLSQSAEDQNWIAFLHRTPLFDAIRADERFTTLLRQVGVLGGESAAA